MTTGDSFTWEYAFAGEDALRLAVAVNPRSASIVFADLVDVGSVAELCAVCLARLEELQTDVGLLPSRVVVRDPALRDALQEPLKDLSVALELSDELPAWDEAVGDFASYVTRSQVPESYLAGEGVTEALIAELFRAARSFYAAAPWRLLKLNRLMIRLPDAAEPWFASGDPEEQGNRLYLMRDPTKIGFIEGLAGQRAMLEQEALMVDFGEAALMHPQMVEEQRRHRWPIATPSAYPMVVMHSAGRARPATAEEIADAAGCMRAIGAFVARHRGRIKRGEFVRGKEEVRRADGTRAAALLEYPASDSATTPSDDDEKSDAWVHEVRRRVEACLRQYRSKKRTALEKRLPWSFCRAPYPRHVTSEADSADSLARFLDWALYYVPANEEGHTIAELAVRSARGLSDDERERLLIATRARYGIFRILESGPVATLEDMKSGDVLRLLPTDSESIRAGGFIIGALIPLTPDLWSMGDGAAAAPEMLPDIDRLANADVLERVDMALVIEDTMGASTEWIDEIDDMNELCDQYDRFRKAMSEPGLPDARRLRRMAGSYQEILVHVVPLMQGGPWLNLVELQLFMRFAMRLLGFDKEWHTQLE